MPCGIYNDQMVYDQINEYYTTMYKCVKALEHNKFETNDDKNQYIRWVMTKDKESDQAAHTLATFFLQQKIQPIDDNTDLVKSLHKLLFLIVAIKQHVDIEMVKDFGKEWDHFKYLFHPEVECKPVIKEIKDPYQDEHHHEEKEKKLRKNNSRCGFRVANKPGKTGDSRLQC